MSILSAIFGGGKKQDTKFNSVARDKLNQSAGMNNTGTVDAALGGGSLQDILAAAKATGNQDASLMNLASSVGGGSALAQQQVLNDPLLAGLYGEGGSMQNAVGEEARLASSGYSLQPEDYEAYGQASGNIAREFGTQEQSLAEALAARGLGAGQSGAAQAQFTGLMGNKFEQLGQMQRQIANDRMDKNMQRLQQTRSYLTQLGGLGQDAQGQQFNQNQQQQKNLQQQYGQDINQYSAEKQAEANAAQNESVGLLDAVTGGLMSGVSGGISGIIGAGANKAAGSLFGKGTAKPQSNTAGTAANNGNIA